MAKGLFTQGMCVLLREPMSTQEIQQLISGFEVVGVQEPVDDTLSTETLVLELDPKSTNGRILVTTCDSPWQDKMADADELPELFVAWSLGQLGPLTYPGCLERAIEHCHGWEDCDAIVGGHKAHLRILVSYVLGNEDDDGESFGSPDDDLPMFPQDYDPVGEMQQMMRVVSMLVGSSKSLAYFNPGGEVLQNADMLREKLNRAWSMETPPVDAWCNVRFFKSSDDWIVLDTVGNEQFDTPDVELICKADDFALDDLHNFLIKATHYLIDGGYEVVDGDTTDGPGGGVWRAMDCAESLSEPPRETIRWRPDDDSQPPAELVYRGEEFDIDELTLDETLGFDPEEYTDNQGTFDPPAGFTPDEFDDSDLDDDLDDQDIPF